jgi:hypothetical protein
MSDRLPELRALVAARHAPPELMASYLEKVRERAYTITDTDVQQLKDAGIGEDEIFEQTVAEAMGEGLRRLDAADRVLG